MNHKNLLRVIVLLIVGCDVVGAQAAKPADKTPDDAAKLANYEAKKKEVEAKNAQIEKQNEAVKKAVTDSNAAFVRKDYDEALRILDAAIKADETHPAVVRLHTNRSVIFRVRGVEKYNASIKATDAEVKRVTSRAARHDFHAAVGAALQAETAVLLLGPDAMKSPANLPMLTSAIQAKAYAYQLLVKFDTDAIEHAKSSFTRYISLETNREERAKARVEYSKVLFDSGDILESGVEAEKVLTLDLDASNPDALLQAGIGLGLGGPDSPPKQRGANYLKKFLTAAPAAHPRRKDAQDALDFLKGEGIVPK